MSLLFSDPEILVSLYKLSASLVPGSQHTSSVVSPTWSFSPESLLQLPHVVAHPVTSLSLFLLVHEDGIGELYLLLQYSY